MSRDQIAFLAVFVVKLTLGLVAFAFEPWLGVLFLVAYAIYVWREIRESETTPEEKEIEPLKIRPSVAQPSLGWTTLQVGMALVGSALHLMSLSASLKRLAPHCIGQRTWLHCS